MAKTTNYKQIKELVTIILLFIIVSCQSEIKQPPGVLVNDIPKQTNLKKLKTWNYGDYNFTAIATFELKAKVLGKERYRFGRESDLSPYDLALGWCKMSDQSIVDKIDISQSRRWFFWKTDNYPISRKEIEISASNMHIIPANNDVEEELDKIIKGEIIYLKGFLVAITSPDGWHWKSSLTRNDVGGGACEVVWVEKLLRIK